MEETKKTIVLPKEKIGQTKANNAGPEPNSAPGNPERKLDPRLIIDQQNNIIGQMNKKLQECYQQINMMMMDNTFKRLDYLFKVLDHAINFEDSFVEKATKEIISIMTPPEEDEKDSKEVNKETVENE